MKVFALWVKTEKRSKRYVVVARDLEIALRHGKSLGEVTSIMQDECDAVFVLDSPQ